MTTLSPCTAKPVPSHAAATTQSEKRMPQLIDVDGFDIRRQVGAGTYGKVYKAEHRSSNQHVALKFIPHDKKNTKKSIRHNSRIEREIKLLSLLRHPNIVRLYDVVQLPNCIVMVQEYISGCHLLDYIQSRGSLKEKEACTMFRQIISAVDYMHRNCIVHRDLKLGNIMLDRNFNIRIIDFGFADTFEWSRLLDTFCGSPCYASPEIVCSIKYTGPEVDIWSMGVVLFCMLCGHLPFEGQNRNEVYAKICSGRFPMPTLLSCEAQHLLRQMLAVDPRRRATMAAIIEHPWPNKYHKKPIDNHMPDRPMVVLHPNERSLLKMPVYQYNIPEVIVALTCSEMALTPIVSIYHLIDESRRRKETRATGHALADMPQTA